MEYQEKVEHLKRYRMLDAKIANLTEELQVWQARQPKSQPPSHRNQKHPVAGTRCKNA